MWPVFDATLHRCTVYHDWKRRPTKSDIADWIPQAMMRSDRKVSGWKIARHDGEHKATRNRSGGRAHTNSTFILERLRNPFGELRASVRL
jgi:hypothetical protein